MDKRIIRVFPRSIKMTPVGDMIFAGDPKKGITADPPFLSMLPEADEVHVSVTFTWDIEEGQRLKRQWEGLTNLPTKIGGPAFGDPGGEFVPGLYVKKGYVITTRGCPRKCKWCLVPKREGKLRTLEVKDGYNVLDNNLLAAPRSHIEAVFEMLGHQSEAATFSGGIDSKLVDDWFVSMVKNARVKYLFLAYDDEQNWKPLVKAAEKLSFLGRNRLRSFVLVGHAGDTIQKAEKRCMDVWEAGMTPFAMYYRDEVSKAPEKGWKTFIRDWTRPAIIRVKLLKKGD